LRLLIDHNLSPRIARALDAIYSDLHEIVALREKFNCAIDDVSFIHALDAEGGWTVLTRDLRIRSRPHERAALDRSRVLFFFIDGAWKKYSVAETAARLIMLLPKMAQQSDLADQGRFALPINPGSKLRPYLD
jgi:hypothetical protein